MHDAGRSHNAQEGQPFLCAREPTPDTHGRNAPQQDRRHGHDDPRSRLIGAQKPKHTQRCLFSHQQSVIMNLQDLITPVGKFVEWTFETVLVPLSNPFNLGVILLVLGGIAFWLRKQRQYTAQARQSGDII